MPGSSEIEPEKPEESPVPDDDEQKKPADKPAPEPAGDEAQETDKPADESPADRFRPEAIAARVEAMGEETDLDRVAREEEKKLYERRKGKKGSKGLATAASKRLAKIGETKVKRPSAVSPGISPEADPLLERTARLTKWIREHRQTFGALVAIGLLGVGGALGWTYWQGKRQADASAMLAQGIADEHGHVSDKDDDDDQKPETLYPTFKTATERGDAALAKYRDVEAKFPGTGAAILARLSEAGILLDRADAKGAASAYEEVKASPLAQADVQVRARAIEGVGFADELLAQSDAAGKDKHLDDALAVFKQLEGIDAKGFKELGKYHEARVLQAKGDRDKAIELLKEVHTAVTAHDTSGNESADTHPFPYLEFVAEDRLRDLDPTALPPKMPKMPGGARGGPGGAGAGGPDMNDPRIQEMIRQMQEQMQEKGEAPPVPPPPPQ
jgi:hypothetical protein